MAPIVNKMRESTLSWLGHVLKREVTKAVRVVREIYVEGQKGRERLNNW